jgi:hypothetical protein
LIASLLLFHHLISHWAALISHLMPRCCACTLFQIAKTQSEEESLRVAFQMQLAENDNVAQAQLMELRAQLAVAVRELDQALEREEMTSVSKGGCSAWGCVWWAGGQ